MKIPVAYRTPVQIRFSDIDRLDHVNNSFFLQYMELARVQYFSEVLGPRHQWHKKGFVVGRNEVNYYLPVHLHDTLECLTRCIKIGNKSLTLENFLVRRTRNREEIVADGIGVLVAMDYVHKTSISLPQTWIRALIQFEKKISGQIPRRD